MYGFHYFPFSLCQVDVDVSQSHTYHVLPPHPVYANLFCIDDWFWDPQDECISNRDFKSSSRRGYPSDAYVKRSILFHRRCFEFVKRLSYTQLCLLTDVVEPTFLKHSSPPNSKHGAFSPHGLSFHPYPWTRPQLFEKLPPELQNIVLEYDIRRLLFVIRTASQIAIYYEGIKTIPEQRLSQNTLILTGDMIQVHTAEIGGRAYISRLSNATTLENDRISKTSRLNGIGYFAVKSDGIGVVDTVFSTTKAGPDWILDNLTGLRAQSQISIIRCADIHRLRIIHDVSNFLFQFH